MSLNWSPTPDGGAAFGDWTIVAESGYCWPWKLLFKGRPMLQAHGRCLGFRRFKTVANAQRWVERRASTRLGRLAGKERRHR